MSGADVHTLTGAYALDALHEFERRQFQAHLNLCADGAREVEELHATGAKLGIAAAQQPPEELRRVVMAQVAGLAVTAVLVTGVVRVRTGHERDTAQIQLAQIQDQYVPMARLTAAPDARAGPGVRGGTVFMLASHQLDEALLLARGLPTPAGGRTYQAWLIGHGHPRSVGLLSTGTSQPPAPVQFDGLGGAAKIGLTIELDGCSPQPTTTPVVLFDLPT